MRRTIWSAVVLLAVPVISASMATTAFAAAAPHTISQGSGAMHSAPWVILTQASGCENLTIKSNGTFVAATDHTGNHGTWTEPSPTKIVLKWTSGPATGFLFTGKLKGTTDVYHGNLATPSAPLQKARVEPGAISGC
jgi:hypothetical protein